MREGGGRSRRSKYEGGGGGESLLEPDCRAEQRAVDVLLLAAKVAEELAVLELRLGWQVVAVALAREPLSGPVVCALVRKEDAAEVKVSHRVMLGVSGGAGGGGAALGEAIGHKA